MVNKAIRAHPRASFAASIVSVSLQLRVTAQNIPRPKKVALQVHETELAWSWTAPPLWSIREESLQIKRPRVRVDSIELSIKTSSNIQFTQTTFNPLSFLMTMATQSSSMPGFQTSQMVRTAALRP